VKLHLQALLRGEWQRAAMLEFSAPEAGPGGPCAFEYDFDYLARWIAGAPPCAAVSLNLPVAFGPIVRSRWPAFLDDVRPMGNAQRWWLQRLGIPDAPTSEFEILRRGTVAPIGNLRIEEALPSDRAPPQRFPRRAVIDHENAFIEYAADAGAQVGGATGAGGDSPKVLLRQDASGQVWIDLWQDEPVGPDRHFLVKFARSRAERDRLILRCEHVYYRALAALGVETVSQDGLVLEEGDAGLSLWLPRFDVARRDGAQVRYGVESLYSLLEAEPGSFQTHQRALKALRKVVSAEDWPSVQLEYLRRDLLNLVFGNSDNHCRNISVLKTEDTVRLAPVYDFAPMKLDLQGVIRTTRWEGYEAGGDVDWRKLLRSLGAEEEFLRTGLSELAEKLRDLPDLLAQLGLPEEALDFPGLGLRGTKQRLEKWGLL
jgi:serine/threonine-protein kinase HipA